MSKSYSTIILAGGLGTRMEPITKFKPKPMILYKGTPLVARIINSIQPYSKEFLVTVKYLKENFYDLPYSYKQLSLVEDNSDTMVGAFLNACNQIKHESTDVIGISSDIVFDDEFVKKAINLCDKNSKYDVKVFLTKSKNQKYKKWHWVIQDNMLKDIIIEKESTGYEKLFIVFKRSVLYSYTNGFTTNMGSDEEEFLSYEKFNSGWIYLLKRLLENKTKIGAFVLEGEVKNINSPTDLK